MNKVRFLTKIALAASVLAALTFTVSCSDDEADPDPTWCKMTVKEEGEDDLLYCGEFGKLFTSSTLFVLALGGYVPEDGKFKEADCDVNSDMVKAYKDAGETWTATKGDKDSACEAGNTLTGPN